MYLSIVITVRFTSTHRTPRDRAVPLVRTRVKTDCVVRCWLLCCVVLCCDVLCCVVLFVTETETERQRENLTYVIFLFTARVYFIRFFFKVNISEITVKHKKGDNPLKNVAVRIAQFLCLYEFSKIKQVCNIYITGVGSGGGGGGGKGGMCPPTFLIGGAMVCLCPPHF